MASTTRRRKRTSRPGSGQNSDTLSEWEWPITGVLIDRESKATNVGTILLKSQLGMRRGTLSEVP